MLLLRSEASMGAKVSFEIPARQSKRRTETIVDYFCHEEVHGTSNTGVRNKG
jgi:hypothetical protein